MDFLYELANSLSPEEEKLMRKFLSYKGTSSEKIDLRLFDLLRSEQNFDSKQVIQHLYHLGSTESIEEKRNSYHQWRNILTGQLEDFIVQQIRKSDTSFYIIKLTSIARFLFLKKKYQAAWKYLKEAEERAGNTEEYELLNLIYYQQIELARVVETIPIDKIIKAWEKNLELAKRDGAMNAALTLISRKLKELHTKGKKFDIDEVTGEILAKFNVDKDVSDSASLKYKLAMIIRWILEEKKDFEQLHTYLIRIVNEMDEKGLFDKHNHLYKIELLTIISYSALKTRNYKVSEQYLERLKHEHDTFPISAYYNLKSIMIMVDLYICTRQPDKALQLLTEIQETKISRLSFEDTYYFVTLHSNLSHLYFLLGDVARAKKHTVHLINSEKRSFIFDGTKAVVATRLIECMINYEMEDYDFVNNRLLALDRKFKWFLSEKDNGRLTIFAGLLKQLCKRPELIKDKTFLTEAKSFILMKDIEVGDDEYISFNAWLQSKIEKRKYYEVFLDMTAPAVPQAIL